MSGLACFVVESRTAQLPKSLMKTKIENGEGTVKKRCDWSHLIYNEERKEILLTIESPKSETHSPLGLTESFGEENGRMSSIFVHT